jgi:hypothetical protein
MDDATHPGERPQDDRKDREKLLGVNTQVRRNGEPQVAGYPSDEGRAFRLLDALREEGVGWEETTKRRNHLEVPHCASSGPSTRLWSWSKQVLGNVRVVRKAD